MARILYQTNIVGTNLIAETRYGQIETTLIGPDTEILRLTAGITGPVQN